MKKRVFSIFSVLLVAMLALLLPSEVNVTAASNPPSPLPSQIAVTWARPENVKKTQKNEKEFVIVTQVKGKEMKLYVSFPEEGGFRLRTDQSGVFKPKGNKKITYTGNTMTAGDTSVEYIKSRSGFKLNVSNKKGMRVMQITNKQISFGYDKDTLKKVRLECAISKDEVLYGTGERYNSLNQVGNSLVLWNVDPCYHGNPDEDMGKSYVNIPLLHSTRGYTMFFNSTYSCAADIGKTNAEKYSLDFNGPKFDMFVWTGSAAKNIEDYTALTGRPILPPKWAFSYWDGNRDTVWSENGPGTHLVKLTETMQKYKELGTIPAVIYLEGDNGAPPYDPKSYSVLKKYGSRLFTWTGPEARSYWPNTEKIPRAKYWNGSTHKEPSVDFTHPSTVEYITAHFKQYWEWGLRGTMVDFGELIREDMLFSNGMTGDEMHNYQSLVYQKAYYDSWSAALGNDFATIARSGCAGSQAYTAMFGGDQSSSWRGLKEQLLGLLSQSSCGFSAWGGDLGGHAGKPTPELYTRWTQFSAFSPLMRAHGNQTRRPWDYGENAVENFVEYYWLRENLLDTLYSAAIRANKTGSTMAQAMPVAFPGDAVLAANETQYLFCGDFLVSPVMTAGMHYQNITLPSGNWYELHTGKKYNGKKGVSVDAPLTWIPVLVRQGTATPIQLASDSLKMSDSMGEDNATPALLVAPADSSRSTTQWFDTNSSTVYENKRIKGGFKINASKPDSRKVVLANGFAATRVLVDGKPLTKAVSRSEIVNGVGFYVDGSSQTIIHMDSETWQTIEFYGGNGNDYSLNATLSDSNQSSQVAALAKDDVFNSFKVPNASDYFMTLDLKKTVSVSKVLLKWLPQGYADSYKIETSTDNENWDLFRNIENGKGGVEIVEAEAPTEARYIRISEMKSKSNSMTLYAVLAQGDSSSVGNLEPDDFNNGDGDDNNYANDDDGSDTEDGRFVVKRRLLKKNKKSDKANFPIWIPIVGGIVVILVTGGVTALLLIKRKKKRKV